MSETSAAAWDVIVVGASFGGLAAALELSGHGRVLLIDRQPVGEGETSACATPLLVLERLGATSAVEQVHRHIVCHGAGGRARAITPEYPYATFDYRTLCRLLLARTDAAFLRAAVVGRRGHEVLTTAGSHRARILVDASGWRCALAEAGPAARPRLGLGIEARVPERGRDLHLWLRPGVLDCGMAWRFPAGESSRVGVACYHGRVTHRGPGRLAAALREFASLEGRSPMHGGFLPLRLGRGTAAGAFLVGDAAGLCLPLTGEGIRPALVFGQLAGRLAARVLADDLDLDAALRRYGRAVRARAPYYGFLGALQWLLLRAPRAWAPTVVALLAAGFEVPGGQSGYWWSADPRLLDRGCAPGTA